MRSRTFLNVSLGILALALAYHLGTQNATAQTSGNVVVAAPTPYVVFTSNGDAYWSSSGSVLGPFQFVGNVFASGGPTPTGSQESFGSLKARYRGEREPQSVKPSTDR